MESEELVPTTVAEVPPTLVVIVKAKVFGETRSLKYSLELCFPCQDFFRVCGRIPDWYLALLSSGWAISAPDGPPKDVTNAKLAHGEMLLLRLDSPKGIRLILEATKQKLQVADLS